MVSPQRHEWNNDFMRKSRMRSRAQWAVIIAVIGFSGAIIGIYQYLDSGIVSIRPGLDAVAGKEAVQLLITVILISSGFFSYGMYLFLKLRK